ncbi:MAG: hypothetical protein E6Q34_07230 [Burkholderiaceae bacterium]|nr:MAG: hypothetical protein E6Q34_07230 [Burkholderiaceae bacterium]
MVRAMTIAADKTIFYGSIGDFGYLAISSTGRVHTVSLKDQIPIEDRLFNDVWQVESTSSGVYFLTRTKIFRFHNGKISVINAKFASSQATVVSGQLFYLDADRGLSFLEADQVKPVKALAGFANNRRMVLTTIAPHQVLVGRISGDFHVIDLRSLWDEEHHRYQTEREDLGNTNILQRITTPIDSMLDEAHMYLYKVLALDEQHFAISTVKAGILILNRQGQLLRVINKNGGLLDNTVAGIFLDRHRNLWAQTNSGISHIELSSPSSIFTNRNGIEGIAISLIRYQSRLYVGTYQGISVETAFQYSMKQDVPQFHVLRDGPSEIWAFKEVDGDLMVATGRGLYKVENESATRIASPHANSYSLGTSPRWPHHLFVGMMGGIEVFRRESGRWVSLGRIPGIEENVRRITTDSEGELWLSTEVQGVIRLRFQGDRPTQVGIHRLGLNNGLPEMASGRLTNFDGDLFLCTRKGLFRAQVKEWGDESVDGTQFVPETRFGKVFGDGSLALNELHSDGKGGVFVQAENGVHWLRPDEKGGYVEVSQSFVGVPTPDESLYVDADDAVWIAGENLYRIDLKEAKRRPKLFAALIRKVAANAKEPVFEGAYAAQGLSFSGQLTAAKLRQTEQDTVQLAYRQNALVFEFSAPYFEIPGSMRFQYQLQGFDRGWSDWDAATSKEYTNIPEGTYSFRVRAKNAFGVISDEAVFVFRILPPWYRTAWAYVLWGILITSSLALLVALYTRRLRRNERRLEEEIRSRTKEVVEQREAAERARHDISLLSEMGRKLTASLDPRAIQDSLYTYVQELITCNTFGVGMVDWERRLIRFEYVIENNKMVEPYSRSLDAKEQPAAQCVNFASELLINSLSVDTREFDSVLRIGREEDECLHQDVRDFAMPRSAIYVPMMLQERVIGVVSVQSEYANAFHENDLVVLRSLGAYAAVAFDNADSYSRLRQAQNKLVEQEKLAALGAVVAGVAHELNTPIGNSLLTASSLDEITGVFVEEVRTGTVRRSRLDAYAEKAKTACELLIRNLANAADLITSFKQIAVDQTSDQRRQFELKPMVKEILFTLSNRLRRDEHEVHIDISDDIQMDSFPGPLGQVLTNLVMNAVIHGFENQRGGSIVLRGRKLDANRVHIQMLDNGHGIQAEHLQRVFEPFFTTKMGQGGSGLGLHITYNIVTGVLGGSITVESVLGKGTHFDIIVPLCAPHGMSQ